MLHAALAPMLGQILNSVRTEFSLRPRKKTLDRFSEGHALMPPSALAMASETRHDAPGAISGAKPARVSIGVAIVRWSGLLAVEKDDGIQGDELSVIVRGPCGS